MTYSKSRLQHALDVYHRAWEHSTSAPNTKERHLRNDYQFRRVNPTSNFVQAISWYDDDSSDEYNPTAAKKRRLVPRKLPKAKRVKHETKRTNSIPAPPQDGSSRARVTLKLKSNAGRVLLTDLANKCSASYEIRSDVDDDTKGSVSKGGAGRVSHREQSGTLSDRAESEIQEEQSGKIGGKTNRSGLRRTTDVSVKVRRGRQRKQANERFSAKGSDLPGRWGQTEGVECVEHPAELPTRSEDAMDMAPAKVHESHSSPAQPTPIQIIRAAAAEIQQAQNIMAGVSKDNPIILDSPRSSPELVPQNEPFTVQTPWAHPINFKCLGTPEDPCHFCQDFRYGIYGYGVVSVEVFRFPGEPELRETGNGHRSVGKEATRMCINCSLNRLYISRCRVHSMQRFATSSAELYYKYISQLIDDNYPKGPALKRGAYYTCSLCSHPAFWKCCADQRVDKYLRKLDDGKGRGCGLILCESCVAQVKVDKGVLKRTTALELNGHDCRRADMEFLFAGSLLHKAWA